MKRAHLLPAMLALAFASSLLLPADNPALGDTLEETYAPWLDRIRTARAELDKLKVQREKAQDTYDDLLRQRNLRSFQVDPETESKTTTAISELDQKIRDKEYEVTTTIPDEARRAGVPSSVLSQ